MQTVRALPLLLLPITLAAQAPGPVRVADDDALRAALAAAGPGTRIELAAADFAAFRAAGLQGTAEAPIVVGAADPAAPPRVRGGLHFTDVAHFVLDGLLVEGAPANGVNIDDGGSFDSPSHHVVLRNLVVRDCGGRGNEDGIKLSGVTDLRIEACTVQRWGRGGSAIDMVGCRRVVVEGCTIRDREQDMAATGVQMKGGTRDVVIRGCRFEHAGERAVNLGGSTGMPYFRPRPEGFEAKDLVVEGCTFVGSTAPFAFVGVDGATVRHNTVFLPRKWVLRILQETRDPGFVPSRGGVFTDNLIVVDGIDATSNVGPGTAPESFVFARNWWFRADAPDRSAPALPAAEQGGVHGRDPGFVDAANGDLRLRPDSPARAHGAGSLPRR